MRSHRLPLLAALVASCVVPSPALAAEPSPQRPSAAIAPPERQADTGASEPAAPEGTVDPLPERWLGVVLTALGYTGFGGGVRVGPDAFGVMATGAVQTVAMWTGPKAQFDRGDYNGEFQALQNGQLNLDGYFGVALTKKRLRIGATAGFKHNTLLQNGFGLGLYGMLGIRPDLAVHLQIGAAYYPDGNDQAIDAINRCADRVDEPEAPCGIVPLYDAGFQPGFSIGLVMFP